MHKKVTWRFGAAGSPKLLVCSAAAKVDTGTASVALQKGRHSNPSLQTGIEIDQRYTLLC